MSICVENIAPCWPAQCPYVELLTHNIHWSAPAEDGPGSGTAGVLTRAANEGLRIFTITEKVPTTAFSWLKAVFLYLRHYAKQAPKCRKKISSCDIEMPMKRLKGRREILIFSADIS